MGFCDKSSAFRWMLIAVSRYVGRSDTFTALSNSIQTVLQRPRITDQARVRDEVRIAVEIEAKQ